MHTAVSPGSSPYSDASLWAKLAALSKSAGAHLVEKVLTLHHTLRDPDTPRWARGTIIAALAYFIAPIDAIPDLIPFGGFADDLGAIVAALGTVAAYVKPEHAAKARALLSRWFRVTPSPS